MTEKTATIDSHVTADALIELSRGLLVLLAIACGVSVATIYFPQAITPLISAGLDISLADAAWAVTAAQIGYAAGLFLLVPLGDRLQHRALVVSLLILTSAGLLVASQAHSLAVLVTASAFAGFTTVVPQILLPMAAGLVKAERRGAVTGLLLAGLLSGVVLARAFGGFLAEQGGWRLPYLIAATLVFVLSILLWRAIPSNVPASSQSYPSLLKAVLSLLREEADLRRSCFYQALSFGGFTAAWTSVAMLLNDPPYHLGSQAVGILALVGAGSIFATPIAGRWIDRKGSDGINLRCFLGLMVAAAILAAGVIGHWAGLLALALGMLLLDTAVQCGQAANQAQIFALRPDARSRLNTAYMTCAFLGGSLGSWIGARTYAQAGWTGVCAEIAVVAFVLLARHLLHTRRPAQPNSSGTP